MNIKMKEVRDLVIFDLEGKIDIDSSELIETIGWALKNNKLRILCNLENIELVDYSGLSILAIAYKNVANHGGTIKFCNAGLHIRELFKVARMDKVFHCFASEEEAIRGFDDSTLELEQRPLRRQFKRADIKVLVEFRPTHAKKTRTGCPCTGKAFNVSGAGLFIYTHDVLPVKTMLKMEISIPKEIAPVEMDGMVIWIADKSLQSPSSPGMGVKFVNVDIQKQKELIDFIDRNITHRSET
ncbi:MAG: STAS domain-containing protein [Candidatus Omnitrophota bacterium]